jgi:hypothetical protein
MITTGKLSRPNLIFAGKPRSLPYIRALERAFTWAGSSLTYKHCARLLRLARDKRSSLHAWNISDEEKKSYI